MATTLARFAPFILDDTYVRQDEHGRYSLNDLHQAAGGAETALADAFETAVGTLKQTEQTQSVELAGDERDFLTVVIEQINIARCKQFGQKLHATGRLVAKERLRAENGEGFVETGGIEFAQDAGNHARYARKAQRLVEPGLLVERSADTGKPFIRRFPPLQEGGKGSFGFGTARAK